MARIVQVNEAASITRFRCADCGAECFAPAVGTSLPLGWNRAYADLDGPAFEAYYCPMHARERAGRT